MVNYFTKKEQIVILIIVLIILISLGFKIFFKNNNSKEESLESLNSIEDIEKNQLLNNDKDIIDDEKNRNNDIMIHISGEIYNPGLIKLKLGDRIIDAVELAGGLKEEADLDRMNLAKKLVDEEKIYIPKIGEEDIPEFVDNSQGLTNNNNNNNNNDKININNSTKEELMTLPGIGEVTANKILEYREENSFQNIEDIMNVSGIGDKKFQDIKDMIITN